MIFPCKATKNVDPDMDARGKAEFPADWDHIEEWQRESIRNLYRYEDSLERKRNRKR